MLFGSFFFVKKYARQNANLLPSRSENKNIFELPPTSSDWSWLILSIYKMFCSSSQKTIPIYRVPFRQDSLAPPPNVSNPNRIGSHEAALVVLEGSRQGKDTAFEFGGWKGAERCWKRLYTHVGTCLHTSIFQFGCCLNPKGWCINRHPLSSMTSTPKGRSRYVFYIWNIFPSPSRRFSGAEAEQVA